MGSYCTMLQYLYKLCSSSMSVFSLNTEAGQIVTTKTMSFKRCPCFCIAPLTVGMLLRLLCNLSINVHQEQVNCMVMKDFYFPIDLFSYWFVFYIPRHEVVNKRRVQGKAVATPKSNIDFRFVCTEYSCFALSYDSMVVHAHLSVAKE